MPDRPGVADHVAITRTHHRESSSIADHWPMGDGTELTRLRYRGIAASNGRAVPAVPGSRLITVAVLTSDTWSLDRSHGPTVPLTTAPTLVAIDQFRPFDFRGPGRGTAIAVSTRQARLTLPIETIDRAIAHLNPDLPLYPLAKNHLQQLGVVAVSAPDLLGELNSTTIALIRALFLSAAENAETPRASEKLIAAIERHIDENLDDRGLRADTIAAAHHISPRQLYNIWPDRHGSLARYITAQRLERARRSLLACPDLTVTAIAQRHGFASPTHFTHKFRDTFGVAPSTWRRVNATTPAPVRGALVDS